MRVPVYTADHRIVEMATPERVVHLARAANAEVVKRRKTGQVVRINLKSHGDDTAHFKPKGNPRRYSHDHETESNPQGCWTLRHLPSRTADIYGAVVNDCIKRAA